VNVIKQFYVPQRGRLILASPAIVGLTGKALVPESNPFKIIIRTTGHVTNYSM